ncbi:MAG: alpha/beta fold hydrolase [Candidatus Nanopelagicales bacterium]
MAVAAALAAALTAAIALAGPAASAAPSAAACPVSTAGSAVRLEVRTVEAAGTSIAVAQAGRGRPLLLLNGTGSPLAEWDPALLAGLGAGRRVVVFDYPGLGESGPAPARITIRRMADWTADLISALGLGQPDVLGWSMGGFVAQQLAVRHPGTVRRLVLAGTNPGGAAATLGPRWVQEADSDPAGTTATYLRTNYPSTRCAQAAGRAFLRRLGAAVNSGRYPDVSTPAVTYEQMVAAEDPWLRSDANARALAGLGLPVLVITGDRDVVTPPANSRFLARRIPGARLVLVPGAGHSFLFQDPDAVARTVLGFLDEGA